MDCLPQITEEVQSLWILLLFITVEVMIKSIILQRLVAVQHIGFITTKCGHLNELLCLLTTFLHSHFPRWTRRLRRIKLNLLCRCVYAFYLLFPRVVSPSNSLENYFLTQLNATARIFFYIFKRGKLFTLFHNSARHSDFWILLIFSNALIFSIIKVSIWADQESRSFHTARRSFSLKRLS